VLLLLFLLENRSRQYSKLFHLFFRVIKNKLINRWAFRELPV
jgi:hypothetical protein